MAKKLVSFVFFIRFHQGQRAHEWKGVKGFTGNTTIRPVSKVNKDVCFLRRFHPFILLNSFLDVAFFFVQYRNILLKIITFKN